MRFRRFEMPSILCVLAIKSTIFLASFHFLGITTDLYTLWDPWYDKMMHWLGGSFAAALGMMIVSRRVDIMRSSGKSIFVASVSFALFVGILWEISQALTVVPRFTEKISSADTILDLFFDVLGGLMVAWQIQNIKTILLTEKHDRNENKT